MLVGAHRFRACRCRRLSGAEKHFTVVALAGGSLEADFRKAGYGVPNKAYLPVGGVLMIVRVLRALREAGSVSRIRCVTERAAFADIPEGQDLCDEVIEPEGELVGSMLAGLRGLPAEERVLVAATDMALLSAGSVDAFSARAAQADCDIGYGFVERRTHDRRYPGVRHTWVRLREGTFCGGGLSIVRAGCAGQIQSVLRRFTAARKSPLKLAKLFSPMLVFKALSGTLPIAELEERATAITGLRCRGIMCPEPEVAVNVDRFEDLRAVEAILRDRACVQVLS